jgi:hypothetical protein
MSQVLTAREPRPSFKADIGYEPDDCWLYGGQRVWVEVKPDTSSFRNVRASLLGLAYLLAINPDSRALLVLPETRISSTRLNAERRLIRQTFRPDVADRLALVALNDGIPVGLPSDLDGEPFHSWLGDVVNRESNRGTQSRQYYEEILKVLIHQRWKTDEPVTTDWITKTVGCSYPTAATALQRLGDTVTRHMKRMSKLRQFPRDEWARLVSIADEVRGTKRFVDRSGQPRSPQSLMHRLAKLNRHDIAIGGIEGARHYKPDIDLMGLPRLDLSLHCPKGRIDWRFVKQLDPALEETDERNEPASLVVHVLRRKEHFFEAADSVWPSGQTNGVPGAVPSGVQYADPVECALDLHEARLESQARELVNFFEGQVGRKA